MKIKLSILTIFLLAPLFTFAQDDYNGRLVSPENSSAIYYISSENKSYSFFNEKVYFSWFDNFNHIQNIAPIDLETYKYQGQIKYQAKIYDNLDYILIDGTLVKQKDSPGYFYIQNGEKRVFTTMEAFEGNGFKYENAIITDISNYPWGLAINSIEENLLNSSQFIKPLTKTHDSDQDGLFDYDEKNIYHTKIDNPDTDGDGINDGEEITNGQSPLSNKSLIRTDTDQDYLNDAWELIIGTDLMNPDTDGDLYLDGTEIAASYDPLNSDIDAQVEKLIKVNIAEQKLEYYFDNKLIDSFLISSGIKGMDTPLGEFNILGKEDPKRYGGPGYDFDYPDTRWNLHFHTGQYRFYIHGAYWHNNFGNKMSHGCVNVHYDNMENLYWFTNIGTKVIIE
jgi:L,D-transpeptidase catalytic domain/Bacterial TSP3 repeat